jgi:hypothetical protein
MTVQEYINGDLPFYHLTAIRKKDRILRNGLQNMDNKQGICVVRSDDNRVLHFIAQQIIENEETRTSDMEFCVFKIVPSKHNLNVKDINCDITTEFSNPLHSYIEKKKISVDEEDICKYFSYKNVTDEGILKNQLLTEGILVALEYDGSNKWKIFLENERIEESCQ